MRILGKQTITTNKTLKPKELKIEFTEIIAIDEDGSQYKITVNDSVNEINPNIIYVKKSGAIEFRSRNLNIEPIGIQTNLKV